MRVLAYSLLAFSGAFMAGVNAIEGDWMNVAVGTLIAAHWGLLIPLRGRP